MLQIHYFLEPVMLASETMSRAHIVLWTLWDRTANHRHRSFPQEPADLLAATRIMEHCLYMVATLQPPYKIGASAIIPFDGGC